MTEPLENLIIKNFVGRREAKAQQNSDGNYFCVKDKADHWLPWTRADFADHTTGRKTFGHYMLNSESQVKFFMYDIDLKKNTAPDAPEPYQGEYMRMPDNWLEGVPPTEQWEPCNPRVDYNTPGHPCIPWYNYELRWLAEGLARTIAKEYDILTLIEFSGHKGLHVYGMTGPTPAKAARQAAIDVLDSYGCFTPAKGNCFFKHQYAFTSMEIEVFPKQDSLSGPDDLGNLIKLPCGIHRKTGRESFFVRCVGASDEFTSQPLEEALIRQPWE